MNPKVVELSSALNAALNPPPKPRLVLDLQPGLYLDIDERDYHRDVSAKPSLSCSTAKHLVLESPAHAHLYHPRLGGQPLNVSSDAKDRMERGTIIHALLLGKGEGSLEIVECANWTKKKDQAARKEIRATGRTPVTRKLYDECKIAETELRRKLTRLGYPLAGNSEVTLVWDELAPSGRVVRCRGRIDHLDGHVMLDLKVGDANPRTIERSHITRMGYDIQRAGYTSGLEKVLPNALGRTTFALAFCEPEPPYCVTPVLFSGSLRLLGDAKWRHAISIWDRCLESNEWPDYVERPIVVEAKPWEMAEYALDN